MKAWLTSAVCIVNSPMKTIQDLISRAREADIEPA